MPYRFTSKHGRYAFPIDTSDRDADHVAKIMPRRIVFAPLGKVGVIETNDERLAQYLRRAKMKRPTLKFDEDTSALPLSCPVKGCNWVTETSDAVGQKARYDHMMEKHERLFLGDSDEGQNDEQPSP